MFYTPRKTTTSSSKTSKPKEKTADDSLNTSRNTEDNVKVKAFDIATPRPYGQKSTAADIYSQKKTIKRSTSSISMKSSTKSTTSSSIKLKTPLATPRQGATDKNKLTDAPKSNKIVSRTGTVNKNSLQQKTATSMKTKSLTNTSPGASTSRNNKNELPMNVTVNSPLTKKKLSSGTAEQKKPLERKNTMILDDDEAKVISKIVAENEGKKLNHKFKAAPKAFYVEMGDGDKIKPKPSTSKQDNPPDSPEDVSYEDDFESYESDFESYESSSQSSDKVIPISEVKLEDSDTNSETNLLSKDGVYRSGYEGLKVGLTGDQFSEMLSKKYGKDEERKLDSGNFDLTERRSAKSTPMAEITEGAEEKMKKSLPDEGFLEMTGEGQNYKVNIERPLFINFQNSQENRRKRQTSDRLKQRAKDLLSIITLHEMHYNLFEMKPIPYELYMATFGRANYTQTACQTFEDGISQDTQTEDVEMRLKWTQHPTDFSNNNICYNNAIVIEENKMADDVYLKNFTFLNNEIITEVAERNIGDDELNPLKVFLEQKSGSGDDKEMSKEKYNEIIENTDFSMQRLKKFLKKVEGRITNALNSNLGEKNFGELLRTTNYSFSKGYVSLHCKNSNLDYLKRTQISNVVFSETKCNLFFTVHRKEKNNCLCCLWDVSLNNLEPLKIIGAIEDIVIARFKGGTEGIFVASLDDSSIHLWDLSDDPRLFINSVASQENNKPKLIPVNTMGKSQTEIDREWNALNSDNYCEPYPDCVYSSAYTSSGVNMTDLCPAADIVGLEFVDNDHKTYSRDGRRKVVGQIASLQSNGYLTIWLIIQERNTNKLDIGKAYWSKYKLEKNLNILLHTEVIVETNGHFNLNSTKKRLAGNKTEKNKLKKQLSRASSSKSESSRPQSAANLTSDIRTANLMSEFRTTNITSEIKNQMLPGEWDSGILCTDLKVARNNNLDVFLIAKNCGEVLLCTKFGGAVKIKKIIVCSRTVTVTCISNSPHGLPYFLAATNSGTIHLCSIQDMRVLLTLDCRNIPQSSAERYQTDLKGRFIGTVAVKPLTFELSNEGKRQLSITSLYWQPSNPCQLVSVTQDGGAVTWDLTFSDIYGKRSGTNTVLCTGSDEYFATLTTEFEIQIHKLHAENRDRNLELFQKYVARL